LRGGRRRIAELLSAVDGATTVAVQPIADGGYLDHHLLLPRTIASVGIATRHDARCGIVRLYRINK
jgi:hypothetical protein